MVIMNEQVYKLSKEIKNYKKSKSNGCFKTKVQKLK